MIMAATITATAPITAQGMRCNILKRSQQVCYQQRSKAHSQHSQCTNLATVLFGCT